MSRIVKSSLGQEATNLLRKMLLDGRFNDEERLVEDRIAPNTPDYTCLLIVRSSGCVCVGKPSHCAGHRPSRTGLVITSVVIMCFEILLHQHLKVMTDAFSLHIELTDL